MNFNSEFDDKKEDWANYIGRKLLLVLMHTRGTYYSAPLGMSTPNSSGNVLEARMMQSPLKTYATSCLRYTKKFYECIRQPEEDFREFELRLLRAATYCSYGNHLMDMLND
ncbi:hypothetical protein RF11_11269 [Thelohanellus kitauei]|uniref:Uncharacterized protein n=1 Tax=Thelohanellus kitauei TaxID=669202 RepID=A0A0C2MA36_THEKT|nr:hypothetical protein RF11_11269 [Thelohanellus kitauei]